MHTISTKVVPDNLKACLGLSDVATILKYRRPYAKGP